MVFRYNFPFRFFIYRNQKRLLTFAQRTYTIILNERSVKLMPKILLVTLCLILVLSLCACSAEISSSTNTTDTVANNSTIEEELETESGCEHTFKEEVQKEADYGVEGYKIKFCTKCHETEYIKIPALESIFEVTVKSMNTYMQENTGHVVFAIEIKNISDKKITSISGNLSIMPPDCILELSCNFDEISIEPHSTVLLDSFGYTFEYDSTNDIVEKKVYEADFENINFYFTPTDIVAVE